MRKLDGAAGAGRPDGDADARAVDGEGDGVLARVHAALDGVSDRELRPERLAQPRRDAEAVAPQRHAAHAARAERLRENM